MRLEVVDARAAAAVWSELESRSFFTSWGWIENWLACLPADCTPELAVVRDGDRAVAAALLNRRFELRRGVIPTRALHLNTTGVLRFDEVWPEYNGLVGRDLAVGAVVELLPEPWDELVMPACDAEAFDGLREQSGRGWRLTIERRVPSYIVDLEAVRATGYLAQLSGQTRGQVRKAQRLAGDLAVEAATDAAQAIEIYDELSELHGAQWRAKGQPGAFADPWFARFHRRLIAERFGTGEIQLLRMRAAGATLGCVYNFVWRGRVLQYQTGLATFEDGRRKPGYVCHAAAIEHCAQRGLAVYDFLGGEHRYKRSLSTGCVWLVWCKVQRSKWRFVLEDQLVKLARKLRERRTP